MAPITNATSATSTALISTEDFDHEERLRLSRSWASVLNIAANNGVTLTGKQLTDLSSDASRLFWLLVRSEYVARSAPNSKMKTAQQLQSEWEKLRPSLVQFLKLFVQKWTETRYLSEDASTCRREALYWAMAEFLERTGSYFEYMEIASKLTFHEKWWSVLSPILMREDEDPDLSEERQLARGTVRSRLEDEEEDTLDRRVRRRVDSPIQLELYATATI